MGATFFKLMESIITRGPHLRKAIICLMKEGNLPSTVLSKFATGVRNYALFVKKI
jgi:hypothetical protein